MFREVFGGHLKCCLSGGFGSENITIVRFVEANGGDGPGHQPFASSGNGQGSLRVHGDADVIAGGESEPGFVG
ncbi:MAG: hypothetical protein RLZZ232_450 [Planctomycetota bacterium]